MSRGHEPAGRRSVAGVVRLRAELVAMSGVLLIGASVALPGTPAAVASQPTGRARIAWKGCGQRLQCARARVPLDWAHPGVGTITLAVIRHLASRPGRRIGSLFVNYGGPGVASLPLVREGGSELDRLGQGRFDVVGWDPRGTGASTHVRCFVNARSQARFWGRDWSVPTTKRAAAHYVPKAVAFARRCAELGGRLLAHVSTADTARDLDYLRRLVGDRRLTYRGLSYGTFLGRTYASMFPRRVRAMVLDGVVAPVPFTTSVQAFVANVTTDTDLVFARFQSLCQRAGTARCALAGHGSVPARVRRLLARLRRGSIPAPSAPAPSRLSYGDLLIYLFAHLGRPASWPQIATGLEQAARGNGSTIEIDVQRARPVYESSLVSAVALQCADKPPPRHGPQAWPTVIGALTRISQLAGPVDGWWLWAPCASWPVASASRYTGPWRAATRNPILVIGTRFDPQTPFANARRAARTLGNAVLLTADGYGHTTDVDPSRCVERATSAYLVHLTTPPRGTVCRSDRQPFDSNFGR